jgi:hypothetical protein
MSPNEQDPLEALLRGLPLRPPSARLDRRLAELSDATPIPASPRPARRRRRLAVGLATVVSLAAAAGIMLAVLTRRSDRPADAPSAPRDRGSLARSLPPPAVPDLHGPPQPAVEPSGPSTHIERVWCVVTGSRVVMADQGPPMLSQQCEVIRQVHCLDDGGRVRIDWTIPGEETVAVPLGYN